MDPFKTIPQMCKCLAARAGHTHIAIFAAKKDPCAWLAGSKPRPLRPSAISSKHPLGFPTVAPAVDQRPGVFNKVFYSAPTFGLSGTWTNHGCFLEILTYYDFTKISTKFARDVRLCEVLWSFRIPSLCVESTFGRCLVVWLPTEQSIQQARRFRFGFQGGTDLQWIFQPAMLGSELTKNKQCM